MSQTSDIAGEPQAREAEQGDLGKGAPHVPPGGGEASLWVLGELLTRKISSRRTGGAYSLFEVITQPGSGPPPHVQHREDEAFYVLEGEYEFLVDGNTLRAESGSLLYVPKGTQHAHRNVGEVPGRMLTTHTPGDLYELFFENAGRPADGDDLEPPAFGVRPHEDKWIVQVASEFGIEDTPTRCELGFVPVDSAGPRAQPIKARRSTQPNPELPRPPASHLTWQRIGPAGRCQDVQLMGET